MPCRRMSRSQQKAMYARMNRMKPKLTIEKYKWGSAVLNRGIFINGYKSENEAKDFIKSKS